MSKISIKNKLISLFMAATFLLMAGCDLDQVSEASSGDFNTTAIAGEFGASHGNTECERKQSEGRDTVSDSSTINGTEGTTAKPNSEKKTEETAKKVEVTTTAIAGEQNEGRDTKAKKKVEVTTTTKTTKAKKKKTSSSQVIAHFIDVGQGDSIFIELPEGECMLIDAGESQYGSTVVSYIKGKGYSKVDYLIATHPHSDHIGGLTEVVQSLDIGSIYMTNAVHTTRTYENLLAAIKNKGKKMKRAKAGVEIINTKNVKASFVAPVSDSYSDLNDYSAIVRLDHGKKSFLFTGDATTKSESEITANISVDVLKVGHHGSDTSNGESFIKRISPSHAIIQVGKGNKYGHPTQDVIARLQRHGAKVYRTDESGTIIVTSDGSSIKVNSKATGKVKPPTKNTQKANSKATENADSKSTEKKSDVVYVTKTGKKYHRGNCSSLSKSKIEIPLKEAREKYEPCKRCNPPN